MNLTDRLTMGGVVQRPKFDEDAFDRPRKRGRRIIVWMLVVGAVLVGIAAAV